MSFKIEQIASQDEWEDFVLNYQPANFLHGWIWGEFHLKLGQTIHRMGLRKGSKLVGVILCIVEEARRGRYLIVPGGPLIDWNDEEAIKLSFGTIRKIAERENCVFARVRPQLEDTQRHRELFASAGLRKSPMHLHAEKTNVIDLSQSEEQLLANMRRQTRYEIRQADKKGITVKTTKDKKELKQFYDLQIETAKRQGFVPFSYKSLISQFEVFAKNDHIKLYRAYSKDRLLAEALIVFYAREADYHYGAGTEAGRKLPGSYAIQWQAIRDAKQAGIKRYNLWGVAPKDQANHRFAGISTFKRGFGGEDYNYLPAHDLIISHIKYLKNWLVETIRKRSRHV